MSHSVYTGVIDLGDLDDWTRERINTGINDRIYDLLDELDIDYHVFTSMVVDADAVADSHLNRKIGRWHRDDPDTSRRAALDNYPRFASQMHVALVEVAKSGSAGATYAELVERTGIASMMQRLTDLKQNGLVIENGIERMTPRGSAAKAYVLTEEGKEAMIKHNDLPELSSTISNQ